MEYPKIRPLGHRETDDVLTTGDVVLLEKLDGANFRFRYHREAENFLFGSRSHMFIEDDAPASFDRVNKKFRPAIEYITDTVDLDALASLDTEEEGLWFFGESLHKHSLDYDAWTGEHPDPGSGTPNYLGFDVYSEDRGVFLPHDEVVEIHDQLGLDTVPVVVQGDADEFDADSIEIPESAFRDPDPDADTEFDRRGLAEGVVVKNVTLDQRAKIVADEFAETKQKGGNARGAANQFIHQYVTHARIEKHAHKLLDEGQYDALEMAMMADLPRRVAEDIFAEHGWDILNNDDIGLTDESKEKIRSRLSSRCSSALKRMLNADE